jgi:hypothetical protein
MIQVQPADAARVHKMVVPDMVRLDSAHVCIMLTQLAAHHCHQPLGCPGNGMSWLLRLLCVRRLNGIIQVSAEDHKKQASEDRKLLGFCRQQVKGYALIHVGDPAIKLGAFNPRVRNPKHVSALMGAFVNKMRNHEPEHFMVVQVSRADIVEDSIIDDCNGELQELCFKDHVVEQVIDMINGAHRHEAVVQLTGDMKEMLDRLEVLSDDTSQTEEARQRYAGMAKEQANWLNSVNTWGVSILFKGERFRLARVRRLD